MVDEDAAEERRAHELARGPGEQRERRKVRCRRVVAIAQVVAALEQLAVLKGVPLEEAVDQEIVRKKGAIEATRAVTVVVLPGQPDEQRQRGACHEVERDAPDEVRPPRVRVRVKGSR